MKDGTGSGTSADSFVGSLISLTSKSEIRYEGILHSVDAENANIALQNVRMFGTEGRKMDGPQIPGSSKIYDYIIFRGSDIKDLQVKSSPAARSGAQPHNDPAIISLQSHHSQAASVSPGYAPPTAVPSRSPYNGLQPSAFRNSLPLLYQPPGGMGTWGIPPAVNVNGAGLAMPSMYWQGYYRTPGAHSQLQQQPLLPQIPSHLPPIPSAQEQKQPTSALPISVGFLSPALAHTSQISTMGSPGIHSPVSKSSKAPSEIVSNASFALPFDASSNLVVSGATMSSDIDMSSSVVHGGGSGLIDKQVDDKQQQPHTSSGSVSTVMDGATQFVSAHGQPGVTHLSENFVQQPKVEQIAGESDISTVGSFSEQKGQQSHKSSKLLLPFPTTTFRQKQFGQEVFKEKYTVVKGGIASLQGNGSIGNSNFGRRGRGRGRERDGRGYIDRHQFLEEFDFAAMNEKFKKEEVWGQLGKVDKDIDSEDLAEGNAQDTVSERLSVKAVVDLPGKPIYVKDDFFDTLSCHALDREGGRVEHMKFSEQRKVDTETFGSFSLRSRGRGGHRRGGYRGGHPVGHNIGRGR